VKNTRLTSNTVFHQHITNKLQGFKLPSAKQHMLTKILQLSMHGE